uniref:Uncharacterized protein n=1 Tax=Arundo donax TaxID=35708 RepID=A0A0A9BMY0_ARUDO
MDPYRRDLLP